MNAMGSDPIKRRRLFMKAMVLTKVGKLEYQEINVGELEPEEVIIDVKVCGVCGTDLHIFHGDKGAFENSFPLVMGHEFSGVVSKIGPKVTTLKVGDRVSVDPNMYCGSCKNCLKGQVHYCQNMIGYGTTLYGAFAEQCRVNQKAAYKIPDNLSFEHAAMVEPVACCLHGIDRCNIHQGDTVAVIGAGSIGQIMLQLALGAGAARVVVIEPVEEKRMKAIEQGAFLVIDPFQEDVQKVVEEAGINSIDVVIECVGRSDTMEMAVDIASNMATVMLFGLTPPETTIKLKPLEQIFKKEIVITGSFINPLVSQRVIDLLAAKRIDLDAIITDRIPLAESEKIFSDRSYRSHGKILILP